ncbi:MAG TPA: UbiA family prenyltransferase [Nitrososphaeraceae archaeon]|nr:UbiA family prenyltransferase [Nitrososphaeraceae archaeon]
MVRQYLLLIRVPNLFTIPSNILAGYFATISTANADVDLLLSLIVSSVLLYVSGIVLNDYFDINVDRKERPSRPLASGRITKRSALLLAVISIVAGNILALSVSWTSFIISGSLTLVIFAYNYRLKRNAISNPLAMGLARFLNVVLGGSPALGLVLTNDLILFFVGYCLFLYIAAISLLSRNEVSDTIIFFSRSSWIPIVLSASTIVLIIVSILLVGIYGYFRFDFIFNLIVFSCVMSGSFLRLCVTLKRLTESTGEKPYKLNEEGIRDIDGMGASREIQRTIKTMILSIIILDSIFLSGLVGIYTGLVVLLLVIPPIVLGRKLYVT